jgi:uncharacterized integral membrane protein (TIGR00698 family)
MSVLLPGLTVCVLLALLGIWFGSLVPIIGAPIFGILLGIIVGNVWRLPSAAKPGIVFSSKKILQFSIIVLGGSLSLSQIWNTGRDSFWIMLISLSVALLGAWLIGTKMGICRNLKSLIGVGTAICGGSAIAAIAPIIKADDDEIAFSISTVFLFNVVAVLIFPMIGHLIHLQDYGFGLWAGTAINDTSSVVAASYSYSQAAGDVAVVTKLTRTTMIIPIALVFAFLVVGKSEGGKARIKQIFPWFILGFLAMAGINTLGFLGSSFPSIAGTAGKDLIVLALAGVGLGANFAKILKTGARPIVLGLLVWALVACTSLALQAIFHQI